MVEVVKASLRVCKGLVAFVVGHGSSGARSWSGAPALLCADLIRAGVTLRNPPIYARMGIMGSGSSDWLRADYEWIVCATKEPEKLPWSDNTACGSPPKFREGGKPSHRMKSGERVSVRFKGSNRPADKVNGRAQEIQKYKHPEITNPGNIIWCKAGGGHLGSDIAHDNEAPFPERLADFFIRSFCPPGGVVYDPFMGSGTSIACAIKTGRKWLGSDLRASQVALTRRRIKQARSLRGFGL